LPKKRPSWKRPRGLSPAEKSLRAEIAVVQAQIDREKSLRDAAQRAAGPKFRVSRKHRGLTGPGARLTSAIVGREVYETAIQEYGQDFLAVAFARVNAARRAREKVRKSRLEKSRRALAQKGLTPDEIARYRFPAPKSYGQWAVSHKKVKTGFRAGQIKAQTRRNNRPVGKPRYFKTESAWKSYGRSLARLTRAGQIASALDLTLAQARSLIASTERAAEKKWNAYRRGAPSMNPGVPLWKDLTPRQRAGATVKRWKGGAVAALYALADIEGYVPEHG
jgi:hypothetical protein